MRPWAHFLVSLALAIVLYPIFNWEAIFILVGGVLIDIDHYIWYMLKFKKFSFISCYNYCSTVTKKNKFKEVKGSVMIFHTIEFLSVMAFISLYSNFALLTTIGLVSHYTLDIIERYKLEKSFITNPSLLSWIFRHK